MGIDSVTDHLPVEPGEREWWHREALKQKDEEIREIGAYYQHEVTEACTLLLEEYSA